jgi:hypothetical protein
MQVTHGRRRLEGARIIITGASRGLVLTATRATHLRDTLADSAALGAEATGWPSPASAGRRTSS